MTLNLYVKRLVLEFERNYVREPSRESISGYIVAYNAQTVIPYCVYIRVHQHQSVKKLKVNDRLRAILLLCFSRDFCVAGRLRQCKYPKEKDKKQM